MQALVFLTATNIEKVLSENMIDKWYRILISSMAMEKVVKLEISSTLILIFLN